MRPNGYSWNSEMGTGNRKARKRIRELINEYQPKTVEDLVGLYVASWPSYATWYRNWAERNYEAFVVIFDKHKSFELNQKI